MSQQVHVNIHYVINLLQAISRYKQLNRLPNPIAYIEIHLYVDRRTVPKRFMLFRAMNSRATTGSAACPVDLEPLVISGEFAGRTFFVPFGVGFETPTCWQGGRCVAVLRRSSSRLNSAKLELQSPCYHLGRSAATVTSS